MTSTLNLYGVVISGHGRFNEKHLAPHPTQRRKLAGTFTVPVGMTVIMYAPPGAYLDNAVANLVETGTPPALNALLLKQTDAQGTLPMPAGYPWTYTAGQEVIDYTVQPPEGLTLKGSPITVDKPTPLRELVAKEGSKGHTTIHYACCSSGYSDATSFRDLFPYKGYYVRLK